MANVFCRPQASIEECDLEVSVGSFSLGPGRLATQLTSPISSFEVIHESQPFLSLSRQVSSSEVFVVDEVVVVFVGLSNGQVQKVYCCVTCKRYTYTIHSNMYIVCVMFCIVMYSDTVYVIYLLL